MHSLETQQPEGRVPATRSPKHDPIKSLPPKIVKAVTLRGGMEIGSNFNLTSSLHSSDATNASHILSLCISKKDSKEVILETRTLLNELHLLLSRSGAAQDDRITLKRGM